MKESSDNPHEDVASELGRTILSYLYHRTAQLGVSQVGYRQARTDLQREVQERRGNASRFNWGFEAILSEEIRSLEEMGLVTVRYGSGAIMAGRSRRRQIYNVGLTDDGLEAGKTIVSDEARAMSETKQMTRDDLERALEELKESRELDLGEETQEL